MIAARLAVLAAIACTMWFNGCYGFSKGQTAVDQYSMVALTLTLDLAKASFLPAASYLWQRSKYLPATVLFVLWPFAFAVSTFAGYSYLITHRTLATAADTAGQTRRDRAQVAYDQAKTDLGRATASPLYAATSACTTPHTRTEHGFCENVATARRAIADADQRLDKSPPAAPNTELTALNATTGVALSNLEVLVAAFPALLIELIASLGSYAVLRPTSPVVPETAAGSISRSRKAETLPPVAKPIVAPPRASVTTTAAPVRPVAWTIPKPTT